jgi:PAS domain S-box-containing protein
MDKELIILILESNIAHSELIMRELRKAKIEFRSKRVDTEEGFIRELKTTPPDLIIASYFLPGFDGIAALFMVRELVPSTPFIMVISSMNEEIAVDCMKAGAADYVFKDHLIRIGPAVKVALEKRWLREEKEQVEEKLRQSEEQFHLILENIADLIVISDLEGRQLYRSPSYRQIFDYSHSKDLFFGVHPSDLEKVRHIFQATIRTGLRQSAEYRLLLKDGSVRFVESQWNLILDKGGRPEKVIAVSCDITERKRAEEALHNSEEQYRLLFDNNPHSMWVYDVATFRFLAVNDAAVRHFGYTQSEFLDMTIDELYMPPNGSSSGKKLDIISGLNMRGGKYRKKDGTVIDVEIASHSLTFNGRYARLVLANDITKRIRAEEALAAEKERLSVTLLSIGDGVIATDSRVRVALINERAESYTGWTQQEAIGKRLSDVFHIINEKTRERCKDPVENVLETGAIVGLPSNTRLVSRNGTERFISSSAAPIRDKGGNIIGVVLAFRDITERRKMEEEMLKASKLESIGLLAGGIAHDFNNILGAIIINLYLAKMAVDPENDLFRRLNEIEKTAMRAQGLTQQLLTFSKGGTPIIKIASIAELLKESALFVLRGSNVECCFSIQDSLWPVEIDQGQMSQVINNIIINARQAMPEGGTIFIEVENIIIDPTEALPLQSGKYVKIAIKDQGIGIPEQHLNKIFDPYFTTKPNGSGLGLAASYSVIVKHEGYITVESELNVGTTFHIYLPASQEKIPTKEITKERSVLGKRNILIMDDNTIIKELAGEILSFFGCDVSLASDGAEAIRLFQKASESGHPFDAVILDLTVPGGMGGKEVIKRLQEIDPKVKAIASSGYSNDPIMSNFREYGFRGIVVKPYRVDDLKDTLRSILAIAD